MTALRRVLLVQLPIPPAGPEPVRGNVPLAGAYLKLYARHQGLEQRYQIDLFPPPLVNSLGDEGLVQAILDRHPWMVGFTCYLWNIERTLWIAARLKARRPDLRIILGGPEITADNAWVLEHSAVDFAAIGEGEQTFSDLLTALTDHDLPQTPIDGLFVRGQTQGLPNFRRPLPDLDVISSPYLAGILDAADEGMLLLETIRGCIFKCKFCYYPKSYDALYFLPREKIVANLQHAVQRGAHEVVLLDPTLNQRRNFADFLKLLADCNPGGRFTYFGELRAEGITPQIAELLRDANFTEVEIGLQSIDPAAMELMDRNNNLRAFERGARAMLELGIKVKVDLIIGLPGDTVESVRRGLRYIRDSGLYSSVQVFNLAILPGTAFRQEAEQLGLKFQSRPPYYVLETPTLRLEQMYELMDEAQALFDTEFDPLAEPVLEFAEHQRSNAELVESHKGRLYSCWEIDLDQPTPVALSAAACAQAFTLWLHSSSLDRHCGRACQIIRDLLTQNPFTTLQVVLEATNDAALPSLQTLDALRGTCYERPTYLDHFFAVLPGPVKGAKRLIVLAKNEQAFSSNHLDEIEAYATVVTAGSEIAGHAGSHAT